MINTSNVPPTEFSEKFIQGMLNAMAVSFHKYGAVTDAYPHKLDALESLQIRLERYVETGNTEFLIDAANFAMIEFMAPRHPDAHYKATDSTESPGRATIAGEVNQKSNDRV
jgi:hypothetical protein